jgi:enoyl-CoA hydratase/carnithine racemase
VTDAGPEVLVDDTNHVRVITLNRPNVLNAFDGQFYEATGEALEDAGSDDDVSVAVITGAGRAFCAGADIKAMSSGTERPTKRAGTFDFFVDNLQGFPKPLIAAVNGVAVGIGVTMLAYCDVVLVADKARLRMPFVELGLNAEAGSTATMPAIIGWHATAELLFTAGWVGPEQAVSLGLASRICAGDALMDEAMIVARAIASMPLSALVANKRLLCATRADAVAAARRRENESFAGLVGGEANRNAFATWETRART